MYQLTQYINAHMLWVTLALTAFFVSLLSETAALTAVVVFGQAHFFISYFYTHKGGKMTPKYLKRLAIAILTVFAFAAYIYTHPQYFNLWIYLTMMAFVAHYFFDEYKLQELDTLNYRYVAILSMLLMYGYVFGEKLFDLDVRPLVALVFIGTSVMALCFWYVHQKRTADLTRMVIFLSIHICFLTTAILSSEINEYHISAFIVLHHYVRWYVYYFNMFTKHDQAALDKYIDVILIFHLFVFVLYYQYTLNPHVGFVQFLFNPVFFYAWTLVHIYMSVRPSDYRLT